MPRSLVASLALWLYTIAPAGAQTVLTLEDAVARARAQSGAAVVARARVAEGEALRLDAAARFRENPIIEGNVGPRSSPATRTTDVDLGFSQLFETGGQRRARMAAVEATVERQRAEVAQVERESAVAAASAFLDGLAADARVQLAQRAREVSRAFLDATERRYAAGDINAIDLNLARIDGARTAATLASAQAEAAAALGTLRALLRISAEESIELRGSLDAAAPPPIAALEATIDRRPEFAVLSAELQEAEAQLRLGRALGKPDLGFRIGFEREQSDTIVLGGLAVTLPAFQRGQSALAGGAARAGRVRLERETLLQTTQTQLRSAYAAYRQRAALADALERDALATVTDNENLAQRSYDAGEIGLMDLLLIRRDGLDTRTAVIDRRLDAARSRLQVDFIAGVLR